MTGVAASAASSQYLWFVSRASGTVLLVLLSAVMVLGVATRLGSAPRWLPRFSIAELHRRVSLFAVLLLVLHVVTAMLDPYVTIGWAAAILPLASPYRTVAIAFGAAAVDLGGAVLLTSLIRTRLSLRAWRTVHWLAYLAWPAAFAHSLTAGGDLGVWWVALAEYASLTMVAAALIARVLTLSGPKDRRVALVRRVPGR
jgi:methionine sulfoxide reductase heme-binding subunit